MGVSYIKWRRLWRRPTVVEGKKQVIPIVGMRPRRIQRPIGRHLPIVPVEPVMHQRHCGGRKVAYCSDLWIGYLIDIAT
jgi:hypothetical protein